jgi:small-conductance mechanosensitive channel
VSSAVEARLLKSSSGSELSLRKAVSNAVTSLLLFLGLMLSLSAVGIDLTALSVLGGAVGVGIGFGLQKLAANYVSGFVILAERSMRIGDSVKVDGFEGRISDIKARYTVIRAPNGRESIVPNEMLINSRVENLSLADSRVLQSTAVSVGYGSDVHQVMALLTQSCVSQDKVLKDPAPFVTLSSFGADGLEFGVHYWVDEQQAGLLTLKSEINVAILAVLRANDIEIPFPQRVVHTRNLA